MNRTSFIFLSLFAFFVIQRLSEMMISLIHRQKLEKKYELLRADDNEIKTLRRFHFWWFVFVLVEFFVWGKMISPVPFIILGIALFFAQILRLSSQLSLKTLWNIEILWPKGVPHKVRGIYRYLRHPNYLAVMIEFIAFPLIFKLYVSTFLFSFLLRMFLAKRIALEENFLSKVSNYQEVYPGKGKALFF